MIEMSDQIPVSSGDGVELTWDDVWRGLVWKAKVPTAFAVQIVDSVVLLRTAEELLRVSGSTTPVAVGAGA